MKTAMEPMKDAAIPTTKDATPELTAEESRLRDGVREFTRRELAPIAAEIDEDGRFPAEVFDKLGALGYLGIPVPRAYGGLGASLLAYVLAIEELAGVCASTALGVAAHTSLAAMPIATFGTEAQKRRYLPDLASGRKLGAFGLTESHAGSDAAATRTRAVKDGSHYVINGSKAFTTNANRAAVFVVTARTSEGHGPRGISSFIVERDVPGFSVGEREDKLGIRASDTACLYFEDCRVPAENLLGAEGQGFYNFMKALDGGRIGIGAMGIGIAQAAFDRVLEGLRARPWEELAKQGALREKVADMAVALHASRLLVYDAIRRRMEGKPHTREAAIAKLFASEACVRVTGEAIRILGAGGCSRELPLERYFRDAKLLEIGEGTSEIQKLVISKEYLWSEK